MKFSELEQVHKKFRITAYFAIYKDYLKHSCWKWKGLTEDATQNDILGFLNRWGGCRIPYEVSTDLYLALISVRKSLVYFNGRTLWEDFSLDNEKQIEHLRIIFESLKSIRKVSSVAISKILHMSNPKFFMMWDNVIMLNYGFSGNVQGYSNFLAKTKQILSQERLFEYFSRSKLKGEVPLLKLVDEYNMDHRF